MAKYYDIDPETCSIEELKKAVDDVKNKEDYYHTMEQSAKTFINSVYGVFGTKFFNLCNTDLAESVTLQGQHLIKFSVEQINDYFHNKWQSDIEAHTKIADKMQEMFPDFDRENFLHLASSNPLTFNTLQCYGDSVTGDTIVYIKDSNGIRDILISELFDIGERMNNVFDKEYVRVPYEALTGIDDTVKTKQIAYVMRHKTSKKIYRVMLDDGTHVDVTEDHSVMIFDRFGRLSEKKPCNIRVGADQVLYMCDDEHCIKKTVMSVAVYSNKYDGYVYDIAIASNEETDHTFFANRILVHNTDSVSKDSVIRTEKHPDGMPIAQFYEENVNTPGESTLAGHTSVHTDDKVYNIVDGSVTTTPVKRIIKHTVKKPMWKIATKSGKTVMCTPDHSLVVFRDGKKCVVKPNEILPGDKVACI